MIEDGKNGLIIERNSNSIYLAVKKLLANPGKRAILAKTPIMGSATNKQIMEEIEELF